MDDTQKARLEKQRQLQRGAAIIEGTQEQFRQDGYSNMLNKYGTAQDNSTAYTYTQEPFVSDMELTRLYEGNGLFAKIIDRPSEEAVKHGYDIDFGDSDVSEYIEDRMDSLQLEDKFATAEKWARLYGGAIIVMLVDDGRGLEEPLNWSDVRSIEELRVFERAVVQPDYTNLYHFNFADSMDGDVPFGEPEYYQVFSVYGYFVVHQSRCLVFRNGRLPEQTTNTNYRYWGIPEYVKIRSALRECVTSHGNGVKLLERCVQAIYKMKNLSNMLATDEGEDKAIRRLQLIDMARGILNSIAIDTDGEDYDFKNITMAGVKDILDATCNMLSAVTDIPQTILFGRSPAGMNSTGENDMENYYNMVENIQKENMKGSSRTVIDLMLIQGKREGRFKEIPRYKVKMAALWSTSDKEQADISKTKADTELVKAQTAQIYMDSSVIDPSEVRKNLAAEGEFEIENLITEDDLDITGEGMEPGNIPDHGMVPASEPAATGEEAATDADDLPAAAVLVIHDGKILAASRRGSEGICGPGGKVERGESTEDAAKREAMEEFNIMPLNLIPIGIYESPGGPYLSSQIFFADEFTGKPEADGDEMLDAAWYTLPELYQKNLFPPFEKSLDILLEILNGGGPDG